MTTTLISPYRYGVAVGKDEKMFTTFDAAKRLFDDAEHSGLAPTLNEYIATGSLDVGNDGEPF